MVVVVVVVEIVVGRTRGGKNGCRVLAVVVLTVIRGGAVTVVRGSSVIKFVHFFLIFFLIVKNRSHAILNHMLSCILFIRD